LKPTVTAYQVACDDPLVAWFADSTGRVYGTLDGGKSWRDVTAGLMGAAAQDLIASPKRTFVLYARTDRGVCITRDGGMSWRPAPAKEAPGFAPRDFHVWQGSGSIRLRIDEKGELVRTTDGGQTSAPCMKGWRIPRAASLLVTPRGFLASGPGGAYLSQNGERWTELKLWRESETGAADFLHAYWMGRYYGFVR